MMVKHSILPLPLLLIAPPITSAERNPKKGVAFNGAQACSALEPHTDSSWWYSWGTGDGFSDGRWSFCDVDQHAISPADAARADGMEFVPMFWSSVPDPNNLSATQIANFQAASHVMGFNEPERSDQANLTPANAAAKWANVVTIANAYNLKIVGPCMTKDAFTWYNQWLTECDNLYPGVGCHHDAVCIHMYFQPHPCDTSKSWECFGDETGYHAKFHLNKWWNDYGKPIWVTEYGCYPWINGGNQGCDASKHEAIMDQLTSLFESPEYTNKVERYNWFTTYASDPLGFGPGALNVPNWEHAGDGKGCPNREFVSNAKPGFSWGIEEIHECVTLSRQKSYCSLPLRISFDYDNCYCSSDACDTVVNTWGGMRTFRELTDQPSDVSSLSASGVRYNSFGVTATSNPTNEPTTANPTTAQPTTSNPTTAQPTTANPTTANPTTAQPTPTPPPLPGICSDGTGSCSATDMSQCDCAARRRTLLKGGESKHARHKQDLVSHFNLRRLAKKTPSPIDQPTPPPNSPPTNEPTPPPTPEPTTAECTCVLPTPPPTQAVTPSPTTANPTPKPTPPTNCCSDPTLTDKGLCEAACGGNACSWSGRDKVCIAG